MKQKAKTQEETIQADFKTAKAIRLQKNKLVIDPREMTIGTTYRVEYQGRVHLFVKTGDNVIDVYEVIEE